MDKKTLSRFWRKELFGVGAWLAWLLLNNLVAAELQVATNTVAIGNPARGGDLPSALVKAYDAGARDITISPGTYIIAPSGKSAIELRGWTNTLIHARQVSIIFEELDQTPIRLERCDGVTLEGPTLRFAEPSFTQGRIAAIGEDVKGKYLDWKIDEGYPVFNPQKSTFDVVDQRTRLLKPGTGDFGCGSAELVGNNVFRLRQLNGLVGTAAVNDCLFTRRPDGGGSIIHLEQSSHCTLRGLTLQNGGFATIFETGGEGANRFEACRWLPGPIPSDATEEQLACCGADGFHSAGVRIGPDLERCEWHGLLHDDCIAIHGSLQTILRADGERIILEQGNRGNFAIGEPVRISSPDGYFGEFKCVGMRVLQERHGQLELTLDRASGAPAKSKASNPQHNGAGYQIINCTLGNTRSRGILVKADNGRIEGCTISGCGMSAISVGPEYYWGEADYSKNVVIQNNLIRNNVLNGGEAGAVWVHGDGAIGNGNVTIEENNFDRNYGQNTILIEDADGVVIASNRFIMSPLPAGKTRTVLNFQSAQNITLKNNVVANAAPTDNLLKRGKNVGAFTGDDAGGIKLATP